MKDRTFILRAVKRMPANASFEKIMRELDELWLAESINHSLSRVKPGTGTRHEDMPKMLDGWLRELKKEKSTRK
jgi:hypothetical protein